MKGLKGVVSHYDWEEWNTVVISVPEKALKGLKNNPNIEILEPDLEIGLDAESESGNGSDRRRSLLVVVPFPIGLPHGQTTPYGVDMMEVRKLGVRGGGQKVCLLDHGYDASHPDLPIADNVGY
jgi:subtilisin family serine protease